MDWTEDSSLSRRILDSLRVEGDAAHDRTNVPHVTELIYCLTKSYRQRFSPLPLSDEEVKIFALGIWLERVMFKSQRDTQVHGELDGIFYSADFLHESLGLELYGEAKTTRISSNNFPVRTDSKTKLKTSGLPTGWRRQLLAYMKVLGVTEFAYCVWFLMGKYNPPFPEFKTYRVNAIQAEIDDNWNWLLARKATYMDFVDRQVVPTAFEHRLDEWECDNCVYRLVCDMEHLESVELARMNQG